jgi:hypothetical protein
LPLKSASETSTNAPFWNAVALNGFTWLLMIGIGESPDGFEFDEVELTHNRWHELIGKAHALDCFSL